MWKCESNCPIPRKNSNVQLNSSGTERLRNQWKGKRYDRPLYSCLRSVLWPLNGSEAEGDLVSIETSKFLLCKSSCPHANYSLHLNEKSREVCIKEKSPPVSLALIGQVTVKWPIVLGDTIQGLWRGRGNFGGIAFRARLTWYALRS